MLNAIIRASMRHRSMVLLITGTLLVLGSWVVVRTPVDVLPDLTAPSVTVLTEAPGMAPQEVELLVTFPLEASLNGSPGVRRIRSVSGAAISVVWVEFDWGQDVYKARQVVTERLATVELPSSVERPQLGPISSIMGEITFLALTSDTVPPMELRRLAETVARRSLLAIPGIAEVVPIGGDVREYQVEVDPAALAHHGVTIEELVGTLEQASGTPAAGFHVDAGQEYLVRGLARARSSADLAATVLRVREGVPLTVGSLATVREGPEPQRGTAAYNTKPAVILSVQKQPGTDTLLLTERIDAVMSDLAKTLPPGITIEKENFRQAEFIRIAIHNVTAALRDEHVQGVNGAEMEVVLRPGRPKDELLAAMRKAVATIPGVNVTFGQPISHRIDHMVSGSKSNLAVKVFGPDMTVLRKLTSEAERLLREVDGVVDISNQEQSSVPQLVIDFDRPAMARYGLTPAHLTQAVEALFQGTQAGEILESGIASRVVVRFPDRLRGDRAALDSLPVRVPSGTTVRLGDVARVRFDVGPAIIRRENVERVAMITANVSGRDLAGTVEEVRRVLDESVELPVGYRVELGGQFETAAASLRALGMLSGIALVVMYGLLFLAFRDHRHALIVLVNLPLALIGGVFAVWFFGGVLSVATLVGFITLFGIAVRNGVLLVAHYQHLMRDEGLNLADAVRQGSWERMSPVLMTALTAGLALIPLVLAGHKPGNEIQAPMGQVILGGLLSSTFLNLVLVPVLFSKWGGNGGRSEPEPDKVPGNDLA